MTRRLFFATLAAAITVSWRRIVAPPLSVDEYVRAARMAIADENSIVAYYGQYGILRAKRVVNTQIGSGIASLYYHPVAFALVTEPVERI